MLSVFPHFFILHAVVACAGASSFDAPALFVVPERTARHAAGCLHSHLSESDEIVSNKCTSSGSARGEIKPTLCPGDATLVPRRHALRRLLVAGSALASVATALGPIQPSQAACLPGDKNVDCIGVYKVPVDDRVLPYVQSPEVLKTYAPDVRWVPPVEYPKSYGEAITNLAESKNEFEKAFIESIRRGKLEDAGVELLDITPKVTVAGRVIVSELSGKPRKSNDWSSSSDSPSDIDGGGSRGGGGGDLSMKGLRAEVVLSELVVALGQVDILLGQGINGQLGSITAAQIQILSSCTEINDLFLDLLNIIPKKM